jgi:hypothetical protein
MFGVKKNNNESQFTKKNNYRLSPKKKGMALIDFTVSGVRP